MVEIFEAIVRPSDMDEDECTIGYFGTWTEANNAGKDWVALSRPPHAGTRSDCGCQWDLVIRGHLLGAIAPLH